MMTPFSPLGPNPKDDGFRVADEAIERAVKAVMSPSRKRSVHRLRPVLSMAASVAVILGLGVAWSEAMKPEPCFTFACQLEALSDEELVEMMDLLEEETLLRWEEDEWTTLY